MLFKKFIGAWLNLSVDPGFSSCSGIKCELQQKSISKFLLRAHLWNQQEKCSARGKPTDESKVLSRIRVGLIVIKRLSLNTSDQVENAFRMFFVLYYLYAKL